MHSTPSLQTFVIVHRRHKYMVTKQKRCCFLEFYTTVCFSLINLFASKNKIHVVIMMCDHGCIYRNKKASAYPVMGVENTLMSSRIDDRIRFTRSKVYEYKSLDSESHYLMF